MDINQYDKLNQYNQNNYRLQPLFSSFLAEFQLDIDHNKVRDWIYAQAEDCTNRVNLTFDEPELEEYYSATMDAIDRVHYDTGLSQQWKHVFKQGWANADNHDRFDLAHTHPRASFVSVYQSLIHISEPTRQAEISYAVFCLSIDPITNFIVINIKLKLSKE